MHWLSAKTFLVSWLGAVCPLPITLVEALHATAGVYQFLLTSKEWMALIAQFKGERSTFAAAGLKYIST